MSPDTPRGWARSPKFRLALVFGAAALAATGVMMLVGLLVDSASPQDSAVVVESTEPVATTEPPVRTPAHWDDTYSATEQAYLNVLYVHTWIASNHPADVREAVEIGYELCSSLDVGLAEQEAAYLATNERGQDAWPPEVASWWVRQATVHFCPEHARR